MPSSNQTRIFLSYAHKDGATLGQRLHDDLTSEGLVVWLDRERLTAGDAWRDEIEHAINRADVVLALLSAGSYISDICRVEQQQAREKSKPVIPILVQNPCEIPDDLQPLQRLDFSNLNLYLPLRLQLVESIQKQAGVAVPAVQVARHNNAPALPENFVPRPQLLEVLRNTLFADAGNRNIALTAMQGMGGIGKTVLARALCHDRVVQQAFPDGIFWFDIGKESQLSFSERIKGVPGLHKLLGEFASETACKSQYRDLLRQKAALIVVDDVWHASDIEPFIAESPRSRLLITTRDTSIGAWFGAREFTAHLLTEAESHQVLAKWCGRAVAQLPPQANDMIHECGYLPLALAMIGAQLKGKPPILWNAVLDHLRHADLQKIKSQFPEPHTTLFRAIQISVDALDEIARERYLGLAVLLEDMVVSPQVQQCIWGVGETEAAETVEQFVQLSLAQVVLVDDIEIQPGADWVSEVRKSLEAPKTILLHDLQLDYVRAQYPDKEALELIHGAMRLSSNIIARDQGEFASQMVGRLLPYREIPAIERFSGLVVRGIQTPWLRPLQPVLYERALREEKIRFVDLNRDDLVRTPLRATYTGIRHLWLPRTVLDCDFLVSMPKIKTHHWAGVTLSMKNMFGVVPGARYGWPKNTLHWKGIQESILDICATVPIHFVIADGIVAMEGNGPLNGTARCMGKIVLADDPVAADATGARLMGFQPSRIGHIHEGTRFLGNASSALVDQTGESAVDPARPFQVVPEFRHIYESPPQL